MNEADALGFAKITWSIIPSSFEFYWQPPGYSFDPARAKRLLAEAGYPGGFDAGEYFCDAAITNVGEPAVNYLNASGIRVKLRPIERAAYFKGWSERKYKGLIHGASGAFGNAATRLEAFIVGAGPTPTAATRISTASSRSRRTSSTRSGARRPCSASSNSSTTR